MLPILPEPFPDKEFLSYIWNFEKKNAPEVVRNLDFYGPHVPVAILKSHLEMNRLIEAKNLELPGPILVCRISIISYTV